MKEVKGKYAYRCKPSIHGKASKRAKKQGKTLSAKIEELLVDYNVGNNIVLKEAVQVLCTALGVDKDYYYSWQSNIAMAMYDAFKKNPVTDEELSTVCNDGAKKFLDILLFTKK